jgi:uncharacterized protein
MNASIYNIFYLYQDRYIIFNTLNGTITEVDNKLFNMLSKGFFKDLDNLQQEYLLDQGILTNSTNELEEYLVHFEETKNRPKLEIQFLISTACNFVCPYCYLESSVKNGGVASSKDLDSIIKWIDYELSSGNYTSCYFELYGGEPLLAKQKFNYLFDSLDSIVNNTNIKIDYSIVTNGFLLTEDIIQLLVKNNVFIQITLDGLPETHNKRRFEKNHKVESFDVIWQNIKKIIEYGGNDNLKIRMNIDKENWNEIEGLAKMCNQINVKNFELSWVFFNSPEMPDYNQQYDTSYYDENVVELWKVLRPYGYAAEIDNFMRLSTCMLYRKTGYVITHDLNVFKCDEMIYDKNHRVGIINSDGRLSIANVTIYDKAIQRNPRCFPDCIKCKLLPICGTGCPVKALKYNGDFDSFYCETTIDKLKLRIRNYLVVSDILEDEK